MTDIKTLLVPFYGDEKELPALESAFLIGKQFGAHIKCLHVSPKVTPFLNEDAMVPMYIYEDVKIAIEKKLKEQAKKAQIWFKNTASKYDVPVTNTLQPNQEQATASWHHEMDTEADEAIARTGRLADIIMVSRVITEQHESYRSAIVAALFETGRPVMIIPTGKTPKSIGKSIVIAWDGSPRSVHAMAMARPFLTHAEKVRIITVNEDHQEGPLAQDLTIYLQVHNITSDHVSVEKGSLSVGSALSEEARKQGADMIVMGAFTHSRIRQMVMGGATSFMLDHAELPVFMMH